ncbi:MAG TPA: dephospho-CoA kinase [Dissulfurispiraceae bacterium]|nr:dephospho-CoA kinase [Dissulfurispiraceae bacterium]
MIVVGLTGNYGMGKSTVSKMFGELGAVTIDTDVIVGELLKDPEVINEIKNAIGEDIAEGNSINKKMLADIVFESPSLRVSLEDILHPRVFNKIDNKLSELSLTCSNSVVVIETPLLYERSYQNRFDRIITVYTSFETAVQNLLRKGVPEETALKRLNSQFPIEMKISRADYRIDNNDGLDATRDQVAYIYRELAALAKGGSLSGNLHGNN